MPAPLTFNQHNCFPPGVIPTDSDMSQTYAGIQDETG